MDTQYLNFAPRFGISYSPEPTLVIRTGYGIFYTQDIGNAYFDMARNIAGRATIVNTDTTAGIYGNSNLTWANAAPGAGGGTTVTLGPTTTEYANAPSHKTTYTQQFLLNIQQQVGQDWSFEVGYQGALHRHLYGFKNANQPTPYGYLGSGAVTSVASRLPFYVGLLKRQPRTIRYPISARPGHWQLQRVQREGYASLQQGPQRDFLVHLGQIPRRYQRNS